ncbi:MAG: hypothetical protein F9K36_11645 [Burkholderiaceae bacterium]|nr:MAG: hypothetical protein F9K36_11645 [Burkholderiaceae bacterium]
MTLALIDNATVSSVQRALGKAKTRDAALLDIEQAALDRFVEAVLFSEQVIVPDNYKQQFTPARKALLASFGVEFAPIDAPIDESLNEVASSLIGPWTEAFSEGSDKALFNSYLQQVEAFSAFIWEHSSSAFFLVFRAHGIGKDSPLIEALLASPKDDELGHRLRIVAKDGQEVSWERLSPHVQRMLSVMGWLGHQYIWYQVYGARHDLTYAPHPLREFFANDFMSRVQFSAGSAGNFRDAFSEGLAQVKYRLQDGLRRLGAHPNSFNFSTPNLLPALVRESSNADAFIQLVMQLRDDRHVADIRALLSQINRDAVQGHHRKRAQLLNDMENIGKALAAELGIEQRFLRLKPPTTITGISVEGDDTGIKLPISSTLYRQYFLTRRYRTFLRDVMADIARPAQHGALKTKLDSWAWVDEKALFSDNRFYLKEYRFPSKFHRPLLRANED